MAALILFCHLVTWLLDYLYSLNSFSFLEKAFQELTLYVLCVELLPKMVVGMIVSGWLSARTGLSRWRASHGAFLVLQSLALAHADTVDDKIVLSPWTETDFRTGEKPWWS